ncbi:MAG: ElyC/SanA/YdcF family protein [Patescibacteria group bacterium]
MTMMDLVNEFIDLYKSSPETVPKNTDGIVVLMGPARRVDISRINLGLNILRTLSNPVPIIFSGVTEEREEILSLMERLGSPKSLTHFQDCGKTGVANTKTQFETLIADPLTKDLRRLAIVTSVWHIPRVKRTAAKFLPPETRFVVAGNPDGSNDCDSFVLVMGEIRKIIEYSARGDISAKPR